MVRELYLPDIVLSVCITAHNLLLQFLFLLVIALIELTLLLKVCQQAWIIIFECTL